MSPPIRVVLIDDHRTLLWGLEMLIGGQRPRMQVVGKATTCAEGVAIVRHTNPDVVLLDLHLGDESGVDAIPRMYEAGAGRVLILTGVRDPAEHDAAIMAGACGIVTKQQPAEDVLKAIQKVHEGELWLDRASTSRVFGQMARRRNGADEQDKFELLTPRERDIVREMLVDAGATTKAIADRLNISDRTLRNHLTSIYDKLDVANRLELLMFANKTRMREPG